MLNCLIIKGDEILTINTKNLSEDNIYKKCGYKSNNNFKKILEHKLMDNINLELWGKTDGLNKYLNSNKFLLEKKYSIYNKCILIALNNNNEYVSCLKEYYDRMINNNEIIDKVYNKNNDIMNNNINNNNTNKTNNNKTNNNKTNNNKTNTDDIIDDNDGMTYDDLSELTEDSYIYSSDEEEKEEKE